MSASSPSLGGVLSQDASLAPIVGAILPTLPGWDPDPKTAPSMADAVALVHARDDARKKVSSGPSQSKAKRTTSRAGAASAAGDRLPGVIRGGGDATAFWLCVEDYFRDVTAEDVALLAEAACGDLKLDPLLRVPDAGPPPEVVTAAPVGGPPSQQAPAPLTPGSGATAMPDQPSSPDSAAAAERRSVRIVSRLRKGSSSLGPAMAVGDGEFMTPVTGPVTGGTATTSAPTPVDAEGSSSVVGLESGAAIAGSPFFPGSQQQLVLRVQQSHRLPAPGTRCLLETLGAEEVLNLCIASATSFPLLSLDVPAELSKSPQVTDSGRKTKRGQSKGARKLTSSLQQEAVGTPATATDPASSVGADDNPEKAALLERKDRAVVWLASVAETIAKQSGALMPVPWPAGDPNNNKSMGSRESGDGKDSKEPQRYRKQGTVTSTNASARERCFSRSRPSSRSVPSTLGVHPYTDLLLSEAVPEHVFLSAHSSQHENAMLGGHGRGSMSAFNLLDEEASLPGGGLSTPSGSSTPQLRPQTPVGPSTAIVSGRPPRPAAGKAARAMLQDRGANNNTGSLAFAVQSRLATSEIGSVLAAGIRATAGASSPSFTGSSGALAPVAAAVAAFEAEGITEDGSQIQKALPLLAAAPQDEILAEILALQSELLAQRVANQRRAAAALRGALADLDAAKASRETLLHEQGVIRAALFAAREERRAASRQRREAAHRAAMAQKTSLVLSSPRPVLGRQRAATTEVSEHLPSLGTTKDAPLLGSNELYDVLAERGPEDEAYCAVCGDGHSEAPNQIVFCERCDVAVHQRCYDVGELPAGEWLCHPCREYEAEQLANGVAQSEVRPPRWAHSNQCGAPRRLPGGARDACCAMCPIKLGAFRKAVEPDGRWVHAVCALWTPETYLLPGDHVAGLDSIRSGRQACAICGLTQGSVVTCCSSGCGYVFHPLCARNLGLYLAVRADGQGRPQYRVYCAVHSAREQERDHKAWAARQEALQQAAEVEKRRTTALEAMKVRESERRSLGALRLNLEQARVLVDLTKKRERLKRQLVSLFLSEHKERLRDPALALARLQAQHAQHAAAVQALLLSGAMRGVVASVQQQQQQVAAGPITTTSTNPPATTTSASTPPRPTSAPPTSSQQATPQIVRGPSPVPDPAAAWAAMQAQQAQVLARLSQLNSQTLLRLGMLGSSPARATGMVNGTAATGTAASQADTSATTTSASAGPSSPILAANPAAAAAAAVAAAGLRSPFPLLPPGLLGLPAGFAMAPPPGLLASFSPQLLQAQQAAALAAATGAAGSTDGAAPGSATSASGGGRGGGGNARRGRGGRGGRGAPAGGGALTPLGVPSSLAAISTKGGATTTTSLGNPAAVPPALRIDRERVMTPKEAEDANRRLPPKFKYVPLQELHAAQRSQAPATIEPQNGNASDEQHRKATLDDDEEQPIETTTSGDPGKPATKKRGRDEDVSPPTENGQPPTKSDSVKPSPSSKRARPDKRNVTPIIASIVEQQPVPSAPTPATKGVDADDMVTTPETRSGTRRTPATRGVSLISGRRSATPASPTSPRTTQQTKLSNGKTTQQTKRRRA